MLRRGRKVADKRIAEQLARGSDRADHRRDRTRLNLLRGRPTMAVTLDQTIAQKQHNWLVAAAQQPDLLGAHRDHRSPASSCRFATDAFATSKNLYNITRNFTFIAIIALGMTMVIITGGIDLSRRLGALPLLHGAGGDHARGLQHLGRDRRLDRDRAGRRRLQRRPDRLSRLSALRGDARHAVDRAQPRDGAVEQHRGLPVRARPRQAAGARRRRDLRHRQPGDLHGGAGAASPASCCAGPGSAAISSPSAATSRRRR